MQPDIVVQLAVLQAAANVLNELADSPVAMRTEWAAIRSTGYAMLNLANQLCPPDAFEPYAR